MEDWIVDIFLKDGTSVRQLTVRAGSRAAALNEAVHQARTTGIDSKTIHYTSVEVADDSRRIYTGGWSYVQRLPMHDPLPESEAHR